MYDFYKSFQEEKCIEKVKKVFIINLLYSPVYFNCFVYIYLLAFLSASSFLTKSRPTWVKSPADRRTLWFWRRGELFPLAHMIIDEYSFLQIIIINYSSI